MALYVKLLGSQSSISLTSPDQHGGPSLHIPNDGNFHLIPVQLVQLPGFGRLWANGHLQVATNQAGTQIVTSIPANELGGVAAAGSIELTQLSSSLQAVLAGKQGSDADLATLADIHSATSKTTPADADEFPIADSTSSFSFKRLTFANLMAWIKSFTHPKDSLTYSVLDHGVVADGTTSNTTALAALVTTVVAAGGGTILFPPCTSSNQYIGSLVINANVPIKVLGYGASLVGPTSGTTVTINTGVTGASGQTVEIEGLVIKGAVGNTTDGLLIKDTSRASTRNVQIVRTNRGILIQNATAGQNSEATSVRSTLVNDTITGVKLDITSGGPSFDETIFDDLEISNCTTGIYLPTSADLVRCRLDATVWVGRTGSTDGVALYTDTNMTRVWGRLGGEKYAGATSCTGVLLGPNASGFADSDLQIHFNGSINPNVSVPTSGQSAMWRQGLGHYVQGNATPTENQLGPNARKQTDTFPRSGFSLGSPANAPMPSGRDGIFFGAGTAQADTVLFRPGIAGVLQQGFTNVFKTGQNTTGNRPSASTVGAGAMFYDTTLQRQIWSDGTNWNVMVPLDSNGNVSADAFLPVLLSTATAAGTSVLTVNSVQVQLFTGVTTQIVTLPTTSITAGHWYRIINTSSGAITINSSGGNLVKTLAAGASTEVIALVATPTTAANWFAT